jgi:hypothetical protein
VSDGFSHIIDFTVNEVKLGDGDSEVRTTKGSTVRISAKVLARLPQEQDAIGAIIAAKPFYEQPYWHIERARVGKTRNVKVELVVNGVAVESREIVADGKWNDVNFEYRPERSAWMAVRIFPSSHTNPIFVLVDGKPIREEKSIEWCLRAVDQCWKEKSKQIRKSELEEAKRGYDHARKVYNALLAK